MKALLIIPAFNEEETIASVVMRAEEAGYDYVVIDDGSKDSTRQICREKGFNCVSLPENLGIGGAMQTGHRYALANDYDIDIQFDGDGQHDIAYVPALIKEINNGANLAIGSRFLDESEEGGFKSTFARRIGIRWLKFWIRLFSGCVATDATSGFRACDRKAIELFCEYYPFDYPEPESIAYAKMSGLDIRDVPVVMHEREGGTSSITGLSGGYYIFKVSLSIIILRLRRLGKKR